MHNNILVFLRITFFMISSRTTLEEKKDLLCLKTSKMCISSHNFFVKSTNCVE